jgi:hypothetical protein
MKMKQPLAALWIALALLGSGLALVALASQVVSAQTLKQELKLPFRFAPRPAAPEMQTPPPGSTVLMTETFGASFAPITDTTGTTPQWRIITNPDDTAGYYWDKVGAGTPITFSDSVWSAARLYTATQVLTPGVSTYPAGQDTWLIYGPIDLGKFAYAQLGFEYYLDSQAGDTLLWGYSTDGQTFYGNRQSGPLSQWITDTFSFRTNAAFQTVYVAFAFNSHADPQGLGAFIRDVRLTAEPLKYSYVPIVMNNYAAPTPTPIPPLYSYTFNPGSNDIDAWGGTFNGTRSGSGGLYNYGQCLPGQCPFPSLAHGNPPNSLRLYNTAYWVRTASSPAGAALPDNYELNVAISPWIIYPRSSKEDPADLGNWYGVIFNASGNTFGTTPAQFNSSGQYYRVYFYNLSSVRPTHIRLDRCSDGTCSRLFNSALPIGLVQGNSAIWDLLQITRQGSQLQIRANGTLLISVTDSTFTGAAYNRWGVFIYPSDGNVVTYPAEGYQMQVDFDNITVYSR